MKIQKVIVSTNSNPLYFDFWVPFSYVWKEKMGADPVLVYIDKSPNDAKIDDRWGEVIRVKSVDGVPEYLQTQWSRFFYANNFPDSVCMTSDIDMFPLSREYFMSEIGEDVLQGDSHLHLNGNGVTGKFDSWLNPQCNLTVCYHVNYGKQFSRLFDMEPTWEDEIRKLHSMNLGKDQTKLDRKVSPEDYEKHVKSTEHLRGMMNWGAEEDYSTQILRKKVLSGQWKFHTKGLFGRRFDRGAWDRCCYFMEAYPFKEKYPFVDCHSVRPYPKHRDSIRVVLEHYFGYLNDSI